MAVKVYLSATVSKNHPTGEQIQVDEGHLHLFDKTERIAIYAPGKWVYAHLNTDTK